MDTLAVRTVHLADQVLAQDWGIAIHSPMCIDQHLQLFVLDLYQLDGIGRNVAIVSNDHGYFLVLEMHFFIRQHCLDVTGQSRHPMQIQRLQIVCGEHRVHAGQGQCFFFVDTFYTGVGVRAAHHVREQHTREFEVIGISAGTLHKTGVLFTFA
jgi:predicted acetyltransferase